MYFHLRMTGQIVISIKDEDYKYITAELVFSDKTSLYFKDYRKFGRIGYAQTLNYINQLVGVEPLGRWFTFPYLKKGLKKTKKADKASSPRPIFYLRIRQYLCG